MLIVIQIRISQLWCPILHCYLRLIMLNNAFGESTFSKVVWRGFEKWVYGLSDLVVHVETSRHLREYCMPSACGTVRFHPSPPSINKPLSHFNALAYYIALQFLNWLQKKPGAIWVVTGIKSWKELKFTCQLFFKPVDWQHGRQNAPTCLWGWGVRWLCQMCLV